MATKRARRPQTIRTSDFYESLSAQAFPKPVLQTQATTSASTLAWGRVAAVVLIALIAATLVLIAVNLLTPSGVSTPRGGTAATLTGSADLQGTMSGSGLQTANAQLQGAYSTAVLQPTAPTSLQGGYNGLPAGQ